MQVCSPSPSLSPTGYAYAAQPAAWADLPELFDLMNYALLGLIFLPLSAALRRTSRSWMSIAAALSCVRICLYFAFNQALSMLSLSQQYLAAATDAQQAACLTVGQAALTLHQNASYGGSGIY